MKITYYNNYYDNEKEELCRQQVFSEHQDEYDWLTEQDVPESLIQREMDDSNTSDWEFFINDLERLLSTHYCLLTGTFGSWRGPMQGGKFISKISDFTSCIEHLDYLEIYEENGHLFIQGCHHDGSDSYELRVLTDKGYKLAEDNYFAHDRKLHNTLFKYNFYSRLPRLSSAV